MDIVRATLSESELAQMKDLESLLNRVEMKLDKDGRLKSKADESNKLEQATSTHRREYLINLIVYRAMQAATKGSDDSLPEEAKSFLINKLTKEEWNYVNRVVMDGSLLPQEFRLTPEEASNEFNEVIAKSIAVKLERNVSTLMALCGEKDKKGLKRLLDQMESSGDQSTEIERTRYKLMVTYHKLLNEYLTEFASFCEDFVFEDDIHYDKAQVDDLVTEAEALKLKASILEWKAMGHYFSKKGFDKLKQARDEQMREREELERRIANAKDQLDAYKSVAGADYSKVVEEYAKVQYQIDQCKHNVAEVE